MKTPFPIYMFINIIILGSFILNTLGPLPIAQAQEINLPVPGTMVQLSPEYDPPILKAVLYLKVLAKQTWAVIF